MTRLFPQFMMRKFLRRLMQEFTCKENFKLEQQHQQARSIINFLSKINESYNIRIKQDHW